MIRCESAALITKVKWREAVSSRSGHAEAFERQVFFEILNRLLDAEEEFIPIHDKLKANRP